MGGYGVGYGDNGVLKAYHLSGFNAAVSTSKEGVWGASAAFNFPSAATTVEAISSDAADDGNPAGTGARTVTIEGLDANYAEVSETVTMEGLSASTATTTEFLRVQRAYVATAGSGNTNAGNITVRVSSGGATLEYIPAGYGESTSAKFTVPAGFVGLLTDLTISASAPSSATVTFTLEVREQGSSIWLVKDVHLVGAAGFETIFPFPLVVPEKADVVVNATGSAAADASVAMGIGLRDT